MPLPHGLQIEVLPRIAGLGGMAAPASSDPGFEAADHAAGSPHSLRDVEWVVIQQAVDVAQGNVALAAARLGISRATLYRRLAGQKLRRE